MASEVRSLEWHIYNHQEIPVKVAVHIRHILDQWDRTHLAQWDRTHRAHMRLHTTGPYGTAYIGPTYHIIMGPL